MPRILDDPDEYTAQDDGGVKIDAPAERLFALMSGHFAGGYDASAARLAMDRKRLVWLERQGELAPAVREAMRARIAAGERETRARLDDLGRSVATPIPQADAMIVSGRVLDDGLGQSDLTVSALNRAGKALACGKTGPGGTFRFLLTDGEGATLMVAGGNGETLLVDDRVIPVARGSTAYRELHLSARRDGSCPNGPDLTSRVVMPDLVGKPLKEAREEARKAGVEIAEIRVQTGKGAEHVVLSSDPPAGRLLADPPRCKLVISAPRGRENAIETVAEVMKAQDNIRVPDQVVDQLAAGLKDEKPPSPEELEKLAKGTDRRFAAATGVARENATLVRKSLAAVLKQLGGKEG